MKKDLITIDTKALILAKDKALGIILTKDAEVELRKIMDMKKLIGEIYEHVQTKLSEEMAKHNIQKIVVGDIVIGKRVYGEKFQVIDNPDFSKEVKYMKADSDKIAEYYEETGNLPKGIILKDRVPTVSIAKRGEE